MAKSIRSIKADLRRDETLGQCPLGARYLFVLLFGTYADDHGRFRASLPLLRAELFPYDDDITRTTVSEWLTELVARDKVHIYELDGQQYGHIVKWSKHQRIDNAARSELPPPPCCTPATDPAPVDNPSTATAPSTHVVHRPDAKAQVPQLAADHGGPPLDRTGQEGKGQDDRARTRPPDPATNHAPSSSSSIIDQALTLYAATQPEPPGGYRRGRDNYLAGIIRTARSEHGPTLERHIATHPNATPAELAARIASTNRPTTTITGQRHLEATEIAASNARAAQLAGFDKETP